VSSLGPPSEPPAGRRRLARRFRSQADACEGLGSPLYARLMRHAADDVVRGGVIARVCAGYEQHPVEWLLALRVFAAVHRLVLGGRAPELARHYPSARVGGVRPDPDAAWPAFRGAVETYAAEIRADLHRPPQTNEVGRSAPLVGGLLRLVEQVGGLPVRLYEIGASAGLNLRADHFRFEFPDGTAWGPAGSPVVLRNPWRGPRPPLDARVRLVERQGCDPAPVDPTTPEGWRWLAGWVWPDDVIRLGRLSAAVEVARRVPAPVVTALAGDYLAGVAPRAGHLTVVWHSVVWQYLDGTERAAVTAHLERAGRAAHHQAPFAHLSMEPRTAPDGSTEFAVSARLWPGGGQRVLGSAAAHGVPVTWRA